MSQEESPAAPFDWWTRQFRESAESWARGLAAAPRAEAGMPWHALIAPAIGVWSQAVAQAPGPEALDEWKRRLDESIAAWSAALEKAMATEVFVETLGRTLDRWLAQQSGATSQTQHATDLALSALGLPSRAQVSELAQGQGEIEERLAGVEDRLAGMARRLEDLFAALAERERHPSPGAAPRGDE